MVAFFNPPPFMSKGKASVTWTDAKTTVATTTSYTFSAVAIGVAAANRYVIVGVSNRYTSSDPTASITVNGVAATQLYTISIGATLGRVTLFIIPVATGTTATIVVTMTANASQCGIGVWAAYGLASATPTNIATSNVNPLTASMPVQSGGFIVSQVLTIGSDAARTHTWVGLTKKFDMVLGGFVAETGASDDFASGQTVAISCTPSAALNSGAAIFASFR